MGWRRGSRGRFGALAFANLLYGLAAVAFSLAVRAS